MTQIRLENDLSKQSSRIAIQNQASVLKAIVGKLMPSCIIIRGNLNFKDNKSLPGKLFLFLEFGDGHA